MEMCYNNSSSSSSSASVDSSNNHLMMGRQTRYGPISVNSILGPTFSPCVRPQSTLDVVDSTPTALLRGYSRPSSAEAYLSPLMDSGQLVHRHLRSLSSSRGSSPSPLTPIENLPTPPSRSPPVYKATPPPVKLAEGEDVLVMDGILVNSSSPSGVNRGSALRPSIDSSGSTSNNGLYKTEICRSWEDSGTCRYGTKCQFAHGKEELRPARHPRYKSEICKSFSLTGTCMFGTKCRYVHQAPPDEVATPVKTEAEEIVAAALQVGTDAADAYINRALYGPRRIRRLPVFEDCCPE